MTERRCPDCDVWMKAVTLETDEDESEIHVKTGTRSGGLLGTRGQIDRRDLQTVACPECGLVRSYVESE